MLRLRAIQAVAVLLLSLAPSAYAAGAAGDRDVMASAEARIERLRKGDAILKVVGPEGKALRKGTRVSIEQTRHEFLFGSNIFMLGKYRTPAENAAYEERFARLFNYATVPFYWWMYEPSRGEPNYAATETILSWCQAHGVTVKGHPLAWNYQDPAWLPLDPAAAMKLQFDRIEKCVSQFKGRIAYWDVVNEATEYDRAQCRTHAPILTAGIGQIGVGEYLRTAFRTARGADPQAQLVINDYRTGEDYADKVLSHLVDNSGHPLYDIIGIQCHQHAGAWPPDKIWDICERFGKFGRPLHFTETTFLSGEQGYELRKSRPGFDWKTTPEGERRQATDVERFYTILFSHPAVDAITWWDASDQGAWQGAPAGLLRADMSPKPAYDVLLGLIKGKWWTRAEARTGRGGEVRFRGFYGDYEITVEEKGRVLTGTFSVKRGAAQVLEVRLE
jgi:endo-1,4-beta-xylanase